MHPCYRHALQPAIQRSGPRIAAYSRIFHEEQLDGSLRTPDHLHTMKFLSSLAVIAALASPMSAAILVSNNALTNGETATLTITEDIIFTVTSAPSDEAVLFVMKDWTPTVGRLMQSQLGNQLQYTLNGGTVTLGDSSSFVDHWGSDDLGLITTNSGYLYFFIPVPLSVGDTITLKAGVFTFMSDSNLNPDILQPFDGVVHIVDRFGSQIGPSVTIPEPSSVLLGLVGSAILLRRRR